MKKSSQDICEELTGESMEDMGLVEACEVNDYDNSEKDKTIQQLADQVYECCNCIPKTSGRVEICPKHKLLIAKRKKSLTPGSD